MISEADVLAVLDRLDEKRLTAWVDGGWGIDALLGETTREHSDLDLVVLLPEVTAVRTVLCGLGYHTVLRDWLPAAIAMRDEKGREIDLHPVTPALQGGGTQALPDGSSFYYPAPIEGTIAGHAVRCVDAATQVSAHLGYTPSDKDRRDMRRLHAATGVELPNVFQTE